MISFNPFNWFKSEPSLPVQPESATISDFINEQLIDQSSVNDFVEVDLDKLEEAEGMLTEALDKEVDAMATERLESLEEGDLIDEEDFDIEDDFDNNF